MVTNCANPSCSVPLRYLRDGRLFQFEVRSRTKFRKLFRQVAHFWLCGRCSSTLTLIFDPAMGVQLTPLLPAPRVESAQIAVGP
jgi:hypothetical protein